MGNVVRAPGYQNINLPITTIAQVLYNAGFRGDDLAKATAISWRESAHGGIYIVGSPTGGTTKEWSFGIAGINWLNWNGGHGGGLPASLGITSPYQLLDPNVSAKLFYAMWKQSGWFPWGPYKHMSELTGTIGLAAGRQAVAQAQGMGLLGQPYNGPGSSGSGFVNPSPTPGSVSSPPGFTGGTMGSSRPGLGGPAPTGVSSVGLTSTDPAVLYPQYAAFLNDPSIGPILRQAAAAGISGDQLRVQLQNTQWWKTHSDAMRQWQAKMMTDPASAQRLRASRTADIQKLAGAFGLQIDPGDLKNIVEASLRLGWSDQQIQNAVGSSLAKNNAKFSTNLADQLRKTADDYGVPVSEKDYGQWIDAIMQGVKSVDDFKTDMQTFAKRYYPTAAQAIARGETTKDFAQPYIALASQTLGIPDSQISIADPKWNAAIMQVQPDGSRAPMTLDQWQQYLKAQPQYGYGNTLSGQQDAVNLVGIIGQSFGKTAASIAHKLF